MKVVPTIEGATVREGIVLGGTVCGGAAVWGTNGLGVTLTGGLRCGLGCTLDGGSFAIDGVWFCARDGLEGAFVEGSFAGEGV